MYPRVTAVINTYARPDLLERALDSVMLQEFGQPWEIIVIHDGPADQQTYAVCENANEFFTTANIPFHFIALEENSGYQCVPKNVAIWHARGDYIAYLDDDNEWTNDHLQVLFDAIEEGAVWPDFVYGRRKYIDDRDAKAREERSLYTGLSPYVPFDQDAIHRIASSAARNFIDTSDVMVAKGAFWHLQLATGMMWNEDVRRFGDWELFTRGIHYAGWRGKAVDHIVQRYHWHGNNLQLTRPVHETPKQVAR